MTVLAVAVICFASCGKNNNTSASLATLQVDGPGVDGSVPKGTTRLYTLANISAGLNYTVRTSIATLGTDTTVPDGTLTVSIYESEDIFKSNPANSFAVLTPSTKYPYIYEINFDAPSSGNYVAAVTGASQTISDNQFFYDLRLLSASDLYLVPFASYMTSTLPAASPLINTLTAGYLNVYSGGSLTVSGSYPIKIIPNPLSAITATISYPQLFVYKDSSLKTDSLLFSSVTNSMDFIITDLTGSAPVTLPSDPNNNITSGVTITALFSSGAPFIVVKGTSTAQYYLTVGP